MHLSGLVCSMRIQNITMRSLWVWMKMGLPVMPINEAPTRTAASRATWTAAIRLSLIHISYRYRNFLQEDVGKLTLDSLAVAFGEHQPIDDLTFSILCDAMEHDERITALLEFDFDSGIISVKEQADPEWRSYRLKDVSTAIYRAERRNGLSLQTREQIFEDALHGQEIQQKEPEEITPQIQGM